MSTIVPTPPKAKAEGFLKRVHDGGKKKIYFKLWGKPGHLSTSMANITEYSWQERSYWYVPGRMCSE